MLRLGEYDTRTLKVSTVRLGAGCVQACSHCGAYEKLGGQSQDQKGDFIPKEVTPDRIAACLLQEVEEVLDTEDQPSPEVTTTVEAPLADPRWKFMMHDDGNWHFEDLDGNVLDETTIKPAIETRRRLIDYFDSVVTTDINQEPLDGDAFLHFYKLVRLLSGGASRVPLITHGIRVRKKHGGVPDKPEWEPVKPESEERLKAIVDAMDSGDIIVLSLDRARSFGNIPKKINMRAYAETLHRVKPALDKGIRVTVSVQGNEHPESSLSRVRAERLWTDLKELLVREYGWTQLDLSKIHTDTGRNWAWRGRAENMPGVQPENQCAVLPDAYWVARHMDSVHTKMGYVDAVSGKTFAHTHNKGRTYNDVATLSRWLSHADPTWPMDGWEEVQVNDGEPLPDLTREFTPQARWAAYKTARAARAAARLPVLSAEADVAAQPPLPQALEGEAAGPLVGVDEELDAAMKVRAAGTSGDGDPGGCGT